MPDYAKTIIYKLINYDYPDLVYVGSTTNLTKRKQHHKESCLNINHKRHNLKLYVNIRENGGWENWIMIKICDYPCDNRREAEKEEDKYMMVLKANMNSHRAFLTEEEKKEYKQQYKKDNKDIIKEKDKEYRENNKGKKKEYNKEYRENNRDKINEKITCGCGCVIIRNNSKRHERTKKHLDLINRIQ